MNITKEIIINSLTVNELVNLWNEHCDALNWMDNIIYPFDEDTVNEFFSNPWDILRATHFGDVSFNDDYFHFNGYGNIETLSDWEIESDLDWNSVAEWLNENPEIAENHGIEVEISEE